MNDWFRSWHGAPTDPKWLGIARRAGVAPGIAVAVAWALMDRASQANDRGSIGGYDAEGLAYFYGCEPEQVDAIVAAMTDKGMITDGRFSSWEKRQPKREDGAAERAREWRERKRTQANASATTDTDTDTEADNSSLRSESEKESASADFDLWFSSWPSAASDDVDAAFKAWDSLSAEDRSLAVSKTGPYLVAARGGGRTVTCSAAKYLTKRMWRQIPAKQPDPPPKPSSNGATGFTSPAANYQTREAYQAAMQQSAERSWKT